MRSGSVTSTGSEDTEGLDTPFASGSRWIKSIKAWYKMIGQSASQFPTYAYPPSGDASLSPRRVLLRAGLEARHRTPPPPPPPSSFHASLAFSLCWLLPTPSEVTCMYVDYVLYVM
jgi:hypothetical protein